jgi:prepilin-type N-terminal cleavage/methylation domain-containing protein
MSSVRLAHPAARKTLPNTKRIDAGAAGFTLIEVVLALTIFALMSAILYGAFALGHSALAKSEVNATRNQKRRSVGDLVGSYIHSAFPYRESPQAAAPFFVGEADNLTFVSAYSHGMGGRGMAKIQITADEDKNGWTVLRLEETTPVRINEEAGATGQVHSVVLEDGIRAFHLAYLDPQGEEESWEERWDAGERRALPRAVRFTYLDDQGKEVRRIFPLMMMVLAP